MQGACTRSRRLPRSTPRCCWRPIGWACSRWRTARDDPDIFWVEPRRARSCRWTGSAVALAGAHPAARALRRDLQCRLRPVIDECAAPRRDDGGRRWISGCGSPESYRDLHALGHAHSIECWQDPANWLAGSTESDSIGCSAANRCSAGCRRVEGGAGLAGRGAAHGGRTIARLPVHHLAPCLARRGGDHPDALPEAAGRGSGLRRGRRRRRAGRRCGRWRCGRLWRRGRGGWTARGLCSTAGGRGRSSSSPGNFIAQSLTQTS
jgi:hypothetical protein